MSRLLLIFILSLFCNVTFGQNPTEAEKLVNEGVALHDKADYAGAIVKYDKALELDKDNLLALAEKAMTLVAMKNYDEAIKYSQKAIAAHPEEDGLHALYVTYGNALDGKKQTEKAIGVYDEGIKLFPDYYQLHFNKGVSLAGLQKYEEAGKCFQRAVMLNPKHASSHNAIARIANASEKRIPSLLAYFRFLAVEPQGGRAKENLSAVKRLMGANVEKTGENAVTINLSPDLLSDVTAGGKPQENNFRPTDMILAMVSALDFDDKNKNKTDVEKFHSKLQTVCASLKENRKDNHGFFWEYYVPYFVEMSEKKLLETYAYIAFASSGDEGVVNWLDNHKTELEKFFEWSGSFSWKQAE